MNRNKVFGILGASAIAAGAVINAGISSNGSSLSDLTLVNIQALAGCESPVETNWGRPVYMSCPMPDGSTAVLNGCDFHDMYYPILCTGRYAGY